MKRLAAILLLIGFCGCGLIPKKVELFQDKVKPVPTTKASERELQRQAAFRARELSLKTAASAIAENAPFTVITNAVDSAVLTEAVSESLGPPLRPSRDSAAELASDLRRNIARLNERLDEYASSNAENVGKKIEGTGLIQVPYFLWAGGFLVVLFIGYVLLKIAAGVVSAMNPGVALGLNTVQFGARGLAKAFSQVVKGGQLFKKQLDSQLDDPALKEKVLEMFTASQKQAQDEEAKTAVKHLIQE